MTKISVQLEDITTLEVDAIVNAANKSLLGGGGVDGAIHTASGSELLEECRGLGGCDVGEAKITKGYSLPAKYIIHTVGSMYKFDKDPEKLLKNCYINSLKLASESNAESIAFPAISTGIFGYPKDEATQIAVKSVQEYLKDNSHSFKEVIFCVFSELDQKIYEKVLGGFEGKMRIRDVF
jgi:O-acetyl-ADP-ribose deacetylase